MYCKIFIGVQIDHGHRYQLQGKDWAPLQVLRDQGREFLGQYLPQNILNHNDLRVEGRAILKMIHALFPDKLYELQHLTLLTKEVIA